MAPGEGSIVRAMVATVQHNKGCITAAAEYLQGDNVSMIELEVHQADVTKLELDAITNAANTRLRHAGGVAAAIARAGGPELQRESTEKAPIGLGKRSRPRPVTCRRAT